VFSIPTGEDLKRIAHRYAAVRSVDYPTPSRLLRELIRDINQTALPFIHYLETLVVDLEKSLEESTDQFLAADTAGHQAIEVQAQTNEIVQELEKEVALIRERIPQTRDADELNMLGKRLSFVMAELDFALRKYSELPATYERSQQRLSSYDVPCKELTAQLVDLHKRFLDTRHWLRWRALLQFSATIVPIFVACVVTLMVDRFTTRMDTLLQPLLGHYAHNSVLLSIFVVQALILTPLLSDRTESFWRRTFNNSVEKFCILSDDLLRIDASLSQVPVRIKKMARENEPGKQ
jgi:hypothetical protein